MNLNHSLGLVESILTLDTRIPAPLNASNNQLVIIGSGSLTIPVGTTSEQPTAGVGKIRYDSTTNLLMWSNATTWDIVGRGSVTSISGSGGTTGLTLSGGPITSSGTLTLGGLLTSANGGTGNGFTKFSGPTTTEKTFTLPDSSQTLLYSGGALGTPSSGTLINCTFPTLNQNTSGNAATVTTNANLTGDVTSIGNATTLTNAPVIAKVLTGYVSGAGTISATDSILSAIQKLNGNDVSNLSTAKSYADGLVVGLWDDRGSFDASINTFPTTGGSGTAGAINKGDIWTINVVATTGTLLGYQVGTNIRAITDTPGQNISNWAIIEVGLGYMPANIANPLSQFASTTSLQLAGVISNKTGTGTLVFADTPSLITPILGTPTSGNLINCTFPTLNQNTSGTAAKATNLIGGNSTTLLGAIPYQSNTDTTTLLLPNTTTTKKFLRETGSGTNGAAPAWDTLIVSDLPTVDYIHGGTGLTTLGTGLQVLRTNVGATAVEWATPAATGVTSVDVSGGTTGLTVTGGPITSSGTLTISGLLISANGGTGNGFTKFTGPTISEKIFTLPDSSATLLYSGGALGTPSNGTLTNCTFPTLNQDTSGTAAGLSVTLPTTSGGTGLTAIGTALQVLRTNASATALEWSTPTTGTGTVTSITGSGGTTGLTLSGGPITSSGTLTLAGTLIPANGGTGVANNANNTITFTGNYTLGLTLSNNTSITLPTSGTLINSTDTAAKATVLATTRAIYGNNFDGSAALAQVIASIYGGTGNGFTKFSGPTTAEKIFTLPDSSETLLYSGGVLGTPSSGTVTNLTGTASININGTVGSITPTTGAFSTITIGSLSYTASNLLLSTQSSVTTYNQLILQNTNTGVAASSDMIVNNNLSTDTTYYGDFGMNSSNFTGSSSFNLPNAVFLTSTTGDLSIGTTTSNAIHFVINKGATDALTISTAGVVSLGTALAVTSGGTGLTTLGTGLQLLRTNTGATVMEWVTPSSSLVGLGNVDNTSDINKPVSTAQQVAIQTIQNLAILAIMGN